MIETIDLGAGAGSVEVYVVSGEAHAGLADLSVRPRYGVEAIVTMNATECRDLSAVLIRAAEALEA